MENYNNTLNELREERLARTPKTSFVTSRLAKKPKKQNYYVFLDIDGTLWDAKFAYPKYGFQMNYISEPVLKPESIEAVNLILKSLETSYNPLLVITSSKRKNLFACTRYLMDNGLDYHKTIYATQYPSVINRGHSIVDFMEERGEGPLPYRTIKNAFAKLVHEIWNDDFDRYVVLEDEKSKIKDAIPPSRRIMSDHNKKSISLSQVKSYLKKNNISLNEEYLYQITK